MKFNSTLDLTGNQLLNFIVHNGSTAEQNAQTGRLLYDTTQCAFYGGISVPKPGGGSNTVWSKFVDVEHVSEALKDDPVYKWARIISESEILAYGKYQTLSAGLMIDAAEYSFAAYSWGNHKSEGYARGYRVFEEIDTSSYEEGSIKVYESDTALIEDIDAMYAPSSVYFDKSTGDILRKWTVLGSRVSYFVKNWQQNANVDSSEDMRAKGTLLFVYSSNKVYKREDNKWYECLSGMSEEEKQNITHGFARIFKAGILPLFPEYSATSAGSGTELNYLYFDASAGKLYMSSQDINNDSPSNPVTDKKLFEHWAAGADKLNSMSDAEYRKKGVCVILGGSVYQYNGTTWALIYEGGSSDVTDRVTALETLLNTDKGQAQSTIDTWNEVVTFLGGIDASQNGLSSWMTEKTSEINALNTWRTAAEADIIGISNALTSKLNAPSGVPANGQHLVYDGQTKWETTKVVDTWEISAAQVEAGGSFDKVIDISALGTSADVVVKVYKSASGKNHNLWLQWEEILADVFIGESVSSGKLSACISLGVRVAGTYKAVIIAQ